jgi:hypothetical protein
MTGKRDLLMPASRVNATEQQRLLAMYNFDAYSRQPVSFYFSQSGFPPIHPEASGESLFEKQSKCLEKLKLKIQLTLGVELSISR